MDEKGPSYGNGSERDQQARKADPRSRFWKRLAAGSYLTWLLYYTWTTWVKTPEWVPCLSTEEGLPNLSKQYSSVWDDVRDSHSNSGHYAS